MTDEFNNAGTRFECTATQTKVQVRNARAVILHPSLGCPIVMKEPAATFTVYLLADDTLARAWRHDQQACAAGGQPPRSVIRSIYYHLKIQPWADAVADKSKSTKADKLLFESFDDALKNITVQYLDVADRRIGDQPGGLGHWANLRDTAKQAYSRILNGAHLFRVDIANCGLLQEGLHDLAWIISNSGDDRKSDVDDPYYELQDEAVADLLKDEKRWGIPPELKHPYKIADELNFELDTSQLIRNYHPVYVPPAGPDKLNVGHLTDVHVSSRQFAFRKSKAQLIPGAAPSDSVVIGETCHATYHALKDLMDQFGNDPDIHLLAFTGDLIDYNRNYDPKTFLTSGPGTTGHLWQEMNLDNLVTRDEKGELVANAEKYPFSIDNVIVYSLFLYYLTTYQKPILLISGNHEAYSVPYGISPRVDLQTFLRATRDSNKPMLEHLENTKGDQAKLRRKHEENPEDVNSSRANPGIPADHNLTLAEAILMYGPDYNRIAMAGWRPSQQTTNSQARNKDWFYTVFSPLTDFTITYGSQRFIALGWGDAERFIGTGGMGTIGSMLPRSTQSVSDDQLKLLQKALRDDPKETNVLLSHFTFANYDTPKPYSEKGRIEYATQTDYSTGTFECNRPQVYDEILSGKIRYTLSGHAHRAGLYAPGEKYTQYDTAFEAGLALEQLPENAYFFVDAQAPDKQGHYRAPQSGAAILVGASGGPIPVQNHHGELAGYGMDTPSGVFLKFDGSPSLGIIRSTNKVPTAKPRFAVAMDYADIVGPGVFERFESRSETGAFEVRINGKLKLPPDVQLFTKVTVTLLQQGKCSHYQLDLAFERPGKYRLQWTEGATAAALADTIGRNGGVLFLTCHFSSAVASRPEYAQYDFGSPWTHQIELRKRGQRLREGVRTVLGDVGNQMMGDQGYRIRRAPGRGEVPDHTYYADNFPREYGFDWRQKQKAASRVPD